MPARKESGHGRRAGGAAPWQLDHQGDATAEWVALFGWEPPGVGVLASPEIQIGTLTLYCSGRRWMHREPQAKCVLRVMHERARARVRTVWGERRAVTGYVWPTYMGRHKELEVTSEVVRVLQRPRAFPRRSSPSRAAHNRSLAQNLNRSAWRSDPLHEHVPARRTLGHSNQLSDSKRCTLHSRHHALPRRE